MSSTTIQLNPTGIRLLDAILRYGALCPSAERECVHQFCNTLLDSAILDTGVALRLSEHLIAMTDAVVASRERCFPSLLQFASLVDHHERPNAAAEMPTRLPDTMLANICADKTALLHLVERAPWAFCSLHELFTCRDISQTIVRTIVATSLELVALVLYSTVRVGLVNTTWIQEELRAQLRKLLAASPTSASPRSVVEHRIVQLVKNGDQSDSDSDSDSEAYSGSGSDSSSGSESGSESASESASESDSDSGSEDEGED